MAGPEQRITVTHEQSNGREPAAEELARIEQEDLQGNHRHSLLTAAEEQRLAERMEQRDVNPDDAKAARDEFIAANKRLVCQIAGRHLGQGVSYEDLVSEGHIGLIRAVDKFDRTRGWRFSTLATWWVRSAITRAIADQGRTIRIPVDVKDRIGRMYRVASDLAQKLGREPYRDEIAEGMEIPVKEAEDLFQISRDPDSLERPVGDDEDRELGDVVKDTTAPDVDELVDLKLLKRKVYEQLQNLTPRQQHVLMRRFGLDGNGEHSVDEIAKEVGLSRNRIRQIESDALRRLKHKSTGLHAYE